MRNKITERSEDKSKKKFKFIDITTADVAFVAHGKTLNELFENAALATFEVMVNIKKVRPKIKRVVEASGHDLPALMFNWLNELLIYPDAENLVFSKFVVKITGEQSKPAKGTNEKNLKLTAVCYGEKIDRKRHEIGTVVKSCTYHKMEIKKSKTQWTAQIILDI